MMWAALALVVLGGLAWDGFRRWLLAKPQRTNAELLAELDKNKTEMRQLTNTAIQSVTQLKMELSQLGFSRMGART